MKILLLSQNRIIIKFLKIASKELGASLDILGEFETPKSKSYDIVIVDEFFSTLSCKESIPRGVKFKKSALLVSKNSDDLGCDFYITKPFLPSDIVSLLGGVEKKDEFSSGVLDRGELEMIKNLLDETKDEPKSSPKQEIISSTVEEFFDCQKDFDLNPEQFVEMIQAIKPKHLRRVLEGATISITIKFEGGRS